MTRPIRIRALVTLSLACGLCSCSSSKSVFPAVGSVALDVVDSGLRLQTSGSSGSQLAKWTLKTASADIEEYGSYEFLGITPCTYTDNVLARPSLQTVCGGSNLALGTDVARAVTVHLVITAMEVRRAFRPDLSSSGDYDGDGVPNESDNCPLVPNPDQTPRIGSSGGEACTSKDSVFGGYSVDNDADGVFDASDNCAWVANPDQRDSNTNGIGDGCEQVAHAVFPTNTCPLEGPYSNSTYVCLTLPQVILTTSSNEVRTLTVDFDDSKTLVACDATFTRCFLDTTAVSVKVK